MLTDDQIAESIGARLHAEVADIHSPADLLTTLRHRRTRRTWAVRGGFAASLAVAAATVAFVAAGAGPPRSTPDVASPARIETVAYVAQQTDTALAHADQYVEKIETAGNGYHFVSWYDAATKRYKATAYRDGRPDQEVALSVTSSGATTVLTVDHRNRSWWAYQTTRTPVPGGTQVANPLDPESIRATIAAGNGEILGHEQVAGRDTLHLRWTPLPPKNVPTQLEMWVDATSYLPLRMTQQAGSSSVTTTFGWLPRSAANLANLDLVPPPGYAHRWDGPPVDQHS